MAQQIQMLQPEEVAATPSEQATAIGDDTLRFKDSTGRALAVKEPNILEQMSLLEILGPQRTKIEAYMGIATIAYSVVEIDGEPVRKPQTFLELQALLKRIDTHGITAIGEAMKKADEENAKKVLPEKK